MEMFFHSHANKTHFEMKGCALGLMLNVRVVAYYLFSAMVIIRYVQVILSHRRVRSYSFDNMNQPMSQPIKNQDNYQPKSY